MKKRVAVLFGGRSPEHDVSVISGLQVLKAIDQGSFEAFPVYVTTDGKWLIGDLLRDRANYLPDKITLKQLSQVTLDLTAAPTGKLIPTETGLFKKSKPVEFDIALPIFHGLTGENGSIQGIFESAGIAYAGPRVMDGAILMDKVATKRIVQSEGIPVLPYAVLKRPAQGYKIPKEEITAAMGNIGFPCILKPAHLGSSIGIAKVTDIETVQSCLPAIFEYDDTAILEPFVENLVEYNVAVARIGGKIKTSAIERPKASAELLDFAQKYKSGAGSKKTGTKSAATSEGMLSLTREINPQLSKEAEKNIRGWAADMFMAVDGTGAPRIDFISDGKTGEIWFNEANPIPGSYAFFLWERAKDPILFSDFLTHLLEEAQTMRKNRVLPADPVPKDAQLLKRPL